MSKGFYPGVDNIARKGTANYSGVAAVARNNVKAYAEVNGVARQWWPEVSFRWEKYSLAAVVTGTGYCDGARDTTYGGTGYTINEDGTFTLTGLSSGYFNVLETNPYFIGTGSTNDVTSDTIHECTDFRLQTMYSSRATYNILEVGQGDYIETVYAAEENAYPDDGIQDGYYWVKVA